MGNLLFRKAWFWFGITFCLLAFIQPTLTAPFQPGNLFVAYSERIDGRYESKIGVFRDTVSLTGSQVGAVSLSNPPIVNSSFGADTTLSGGGGIALDEFGNLYVTVEKFEGTDYRGIIKFDPNGNVALKINGGTTTIDFHGIAVRDGVIYVASESGIRRFNATNGNSISSIISSRTAFRDVAFDRDGNLYAVRQTRDGRLVVRRWSAGNYQGEGKVVFAVGGSYANSDPRAIVIDDDGFIYITLSNSKTVIKVLPDSTGSDSETSDIGAILATYLTPPGTGSLIGLDYDPGTQRLFASHTGTGIGQILWIDKNAPSGETMSPFGPTNLSGVRWITVYHTHEPVTAMLLAAGLLLLGRRFRRK